MKHTNYEVCDDFQEEIIKVQSCGDNAECFSNNSDGILVNLLNFVKCIVNVKKGNFNKCIYLVNDVFYGYNKILVYFDFNNENVIREKNNLIYIGINIKDIKSEENALANYIKIQKVKQHFLILEVRKNIYSKVFSISCYHIITEKYVNSIK